MAGWRGRAATLGVVLAVAIGFAAAAPGFRFTTQITAFLPDDGANRGAQIAALLAHSDLAKVMILDLSLGEPGANPEALAALTRSLLAFLEARPDVASARSGITEADVTAMLDFLQALPPTTFLPRTAYSDDGLRARLAGLRDQLASPAGVLVRQTAARDPLGGIWEPLEALRSVQGAALVDRGGVLFTADLHHAFVFVETRASPFDSAAQQQFRAALDGWIAQAAPPPARLQTAGTAQFAIASEAQMKGDVNRIGIVSTIGILILFLVLFGSPRLIGLGMVPLVTGSAVAVLACHALFGEIHGITIAFGTSLLGVGLDYVEHYYAHFVLTPSVPATATMRRVAPSLVLGGLTTIIGFIGLGAAGLAGLREMAVFSVIAIITSMAATCLIVPRWMPARYRAPRTLGLVHSAVLALVVRLTRQRWGRSARWAGAAAVAIAAVLGVRAAEFSDNVNMLVSDAGAHVADDRAVRARLGPQAGSFAVVTAAGDDALVAALGQAAIELERARAAGTVASFAPLAQLLPSRAEQAARLAAARDAAPRLRAVMEELAFVPDQFAPYWDALAAPSPQLLTLAELRRSPLAPLIRAWLPGSAASVGEAGETATASPAGRPVESIALIPLTGVTDLGALRAQVPSATIVAPRETMVELFRGVRIRTVVAATVGFAAIFLLLAVRYRSARKARVALTPAVLACVATVGVLVAAGVPLTILHVMSLLLVVSLGVDFGIFFVDTTETVEESARTMVSIITASITTILSFGLLGLSDSPGLAAIGVTVTLGVSFSLVFCFAMTSVAGHREPREVAP